LFGEGLLALKKKGAATDMKAGKQEAVGRDGNDDDTKQKAGTSRAMKMMFQMDAQEMSDKLREDVRLSMLNRLWGSQQSHSVQLDSTGLL
jgi:hypothetical protein